LILSFGFLFLSLDEKYRIHERVDFFIHKLLFEWIGFIETGLSDRLDDILILFYLLLGIYLIKKSKSEVIHFSKAKPYFLISIFLTSLMVTLDILTNRLDILEFIFQYESAISIKPILIVLEESFKLFSSTFLIATAIRCMSISMHIKDRRDY